MTVPVDDMSVMSIRTTMDIKALLSNVSDVSELSTVPYCLLVWLLSEWSDGCSNSNSELLTSLVGKSIISSCPGSDCLCSVIESEPLLVVLRVIVSDSQSELVATNMLMPEEGSILLHS